MSVFDNIKIERVGTREKCRKTAGVRVLSSCFCDLLGIKHTKCTFFSGKF